MRRKMVAACLAAGFAAPVLANDMGAVLAELKRLAARVEVLEKQNKDLEKALDSQRLSEQEPELVTRLKAVEFQTLSMQKQARQIEALEGITVGASLTSVLQKSAAAHTSTGAEETRANYRGDISVTLPGGSLGQAEGKIFTHLRFGQGRGLGLRPTYSSTPNTSAFEVGSTPADDSFGILAQAWYQLTVPLTGEDGRKANAREHLHFTAGKIDPFVFFDQNSIADDESTRFLNNAFVHNPLLDSGGDVRADAYGFAPGFIAQYVNQKQKGGDWGLSLGVFGSGPGANFSGSLGMPFVIAQAETMTRWNYLPGNYRLYTWRNGRGSNYDGIERKHAGWGFSADQKVHEDFSVFARYGHGTKGQVRFDRALTFGAEISGGLWGRGRDAVGIAHGRLRTSAAFVADSLANAGYQASGHESQTELYYRFRINERAELSPDLQWIQRPGGDATAATVKVVGLRAKVGF